MSFPSMKISPLFGLLLPVVGFVTLSLAGLGEEYRSLPRANTKQLYGFMIDAARTPESMEYYERLVDFCSKWGYNTIILRLTDDQGSALKFHSHPELLTHRNALSSTDITHLVQFAEAREIQLIPEVESFGHSRYITSVPQYADLVDKDTIPEKGSPDFNGLIPSHPQTLGLMKDLFRETAALFPSPFLHAGCDEVDWGGSEFSRTALKTHSRAQVWAKYINSLDEIAKNLGKELIIWGDYPLRVDPEVLPLLNKDIILMDWDYGQKDPKALAAIAHKILGNGLRLIGAPALTHCGWGARVGNDQLRNVDAYEEAYKKLRDGRVLGIVVTNWLPSRYIQDSIWDEIAYAGVSIRDGSAAARESAFRYFVERHYGAAWNDAWADVFNICYAITPYCTSRCAPPWAWPKLQAPWHDAQGLISAVGDATANPPPFQQILKELDRLKPSVSRNTEDFNAFRLSVEYMSQLFWRNSTILGEVDKKIINNQSATATIRTIARRDHKLLQALSAGWDSGRPSNSEVKSTMVFPAAEDQLLFRLSEAAAYSTALAKDPDRFLAILELAKHTARPSASAQYTVFRK